MSQTKEQLLDSFRSMDIPTLQKLQKYAELLIIPDEDLCTNVTMIQMVEKAHQLANVLFPEWTDRSKSDFGEFLIELFALFSEKDFWYINAFANEGLLRKTRSYPNAFLKALQLGYSPTRVKGARASFNLIFGGTGVIEYPIGSLILAVQGYRFTNDEVFTISTDTEVLSLCEGTYLSEDATFNGYNILISKANIDLDSIRVIIDNIIYTKVQTFGDSGEDSTHYVVLPEQEGSASIFFGSNGYGAAPEIGKVVHIEYRKCSGILANGKTGEVTVISSLEARPAISATIVGSAAGGLDAESITSIKEKTPLYFGNRKAALNTISAKEILETYPLIQRAKVTVLGNTVSYRVIMRSGAAEPTLTEQQAIEADFTPCLPLGYVSNYVENAYIDFISGNSATSLKISAYVSRGYNLTNIEATIRQVLTDMTSPSILADYGKGFSKLEYDAIIKSRAVGLQNIVWAKQDNTALPDLVLAETSIFTPIDQTKVIISVYVSR